jgi:hypothetical protein
MPVVVREIPFFIDRAMSRKYITAKKWMLTALFMALHNTGAATAVWLLASMATSLLV